MLQFVYLFAENAQRFLLSRDALNVLDTEKMTVIVVYQLNDSEICIRWEEILMSSILWFTDLA